MCFNYYNLYIIFVHFMIMSYLIGNALMRLSNSYLIGNASMRLSNYLKGFEMVELLRQSGRGSTGPIALIGLSDPSNL